VRALKQSAKDWLEWTRLAPAARASQAQDRQGVPKVDAGPARIIDECIAWIARAQDRSHTQDGGVARHYSLVEGWASSYPETTGYIVPTLLACAQDASQDDLIGRARRMLDWLVSIQFPEGGFQGGMVDQEPRVPVTFNTGQILLGLAAGVGLDESYRKPMQLAADWLTSVQDPDGCWRRYSSPFAAKGDKTYDTHVALGLFAAHSVCDKRGYAEAGLRQVDWALGNQLGNGWLAQCCLDDPQRPLTHTLGYALRGIIGAYNNSGQDRYLLAACRTADGLIGALDSEGRLPGRLDDHWRSASNWVCLTGASQIAECWLLLHRATARNDYREAALRTNAFVRRTIVVDGPAEISGGVKGSFPVDGGYGRWQYLNWACKFAIDANRLELALAK
jgi:hypothetical protein